MKVCPFKEYSEIFGKSGEGAHSLRILDTPVVDYIGTILLAMLLTKITDIPLTITTIIMFVVAIIFHVLFGVSTASTRFLGFTC